MRLPDPRIRVVARAINDWSSESLHPIATRTPFWFTGQAQRRGINRRADIRAAVRVLRHLDGDVIDQWTETIPSCGGEIRGWISPPHGTDMRVHVTVRRHP